MSEALVGTVPRLLSCMAGAAIPPDELWRILELPPAHIIDICASRSNQFKHATWANVMPKWFGASPLAQRLHFGLSIDPFRVTVIDMAATLKDRGLINGFCYEDNLYVGHDIANACDGAYITRVASNGTPSVLYMQTRMWQDGFQPADLVKELEAINYAESVPVVHCIVATRLGGDLDACVMAQDSHVLILTSWSKTVPAEYTLHNRCLLWHPKGEKRWFRWPSQETHCVITESLADSLTVIAVRPDLEVVIPHPGVVREVIGPNLFDALLEAQQQVLSDRLTPVKLRRISDTEAIAEAITMIADERGCTDQERDDDIATLHRQRIRTVGDLRVLKSSSIEALGLDPVATSYLLRIHAGRRRSPGTTRFEE